MRAEYVKVTAHNSFMAECVICECSHCVQSRAYVYVHICVCIYVYVYIHMHVAGIVYNYDSLCTSTLLQGCVP